MLLFQNNEAFLDLENAVNRQANPLEHEAMAPCIVTGLIFLTEKKKSVFQKTSYTEILKQ